MGYFLGVALILLLTFSYCNLLKRSFAYCLPFSILSIISALYIFGLFTILKIGAYIISASILILFIVVLVKVIRKKEKFDFKFSNFSFIFFIVFALVQFFILRNVVLSSWDEFSHWGIIVKNMFYFGNFGNIDKPVLFPGYPPATGIFHAFFMFLGNKFVEGYLYMSMNLLSIAFILPIFDSFKNKNFIANGMVIVVGLLVPTIYLDNFFTSIYVDIIMGIIFAYMIITYLSSCKIDRLLIANISLSCFVLCTIKEAGLGLSLIALFIIVINSIIFKKVEIKDFFKKKLNIIFSFMPVVAIILAKVSWSCYITIFELKEAWSTSEVTLKGILKAFVKPTEYQDSILRTFLSRVLAIYYNGSLNLSIVTMMLLICLMYMIPNIIKKEKNSNDIYMSIAIFVGFVIYLISMLILYWFTYSEYEATRLASFERYCATYLVACSILLVYKFVAELGKLTEQGNSNNILKCFAVWLSFVAFTFVPAASLIYNTFIPTFEKRAVLKDFEEFVQDLEYNKDIVWFVECNSTGYNYQQASFIATPVTINKNFTWSLGAPRYSGDVWSYNITAEVWANQLKEGNYTYVYLQNVDEIFIDTYAPLFDSAENIKDYSEFKVQIDGDQVKLVKV